MRIPSIVSALPALFCATLLSGCTLTTIAPVRTLPAHITRVYVPQVTNQTSEYSIGPELTTALQDAILVDGRLTLVPNKEADVRIEVKLTDFRRDMLGRGSEEFNVATQLGADATIDMYDPYDGVRAAPLLRRKATANWTAITDPRTLAAEAETDVRTRLVQNLAQAIVQAILTGQNEALTPEETAASQKAKAMLPPVVPTQTVPRYPDPSKVNIRP